MSFYLVLPIIQAALSLFLLILVLRSKSQDAARLIFALYLGGLITWGALIFLMRSSPSAEQAYFWEKLLLPLALFISVVIYHFSIVFGGFNVNKWRILSGYAGCALVLILSELGWVVAGMQLKSYGYAPAPGPLFPVVALGSYISYMVATGYLWKYSRTTLTHDERNRANYILIGMVASIIGGAFDALPILGLPLYPGVIFGNIVFCILTSIAILKYHLLGIQIIVRKGITYFLTSAIAAAPYLLVLFVVPAVIGTIIPVWVSVFLLVILAFALQPIWRTVQNLVDKLFNMSRYDFLKELDEFSRKTHRIGNIADLGNSLVKLMERALQTSDVYLFVSSELGDFKLISSSKTSLSAPDSFSQNPVLGWLRSHKGVLHREDLNYISRLQSLTVQEMEEINTVRAELFVPVFGTEDKLVGILVLGPKLNHQPYSDEDEQMILTVTQRLALKLENARLYSLEIAARQELQKQSDMKTEFLHNAAHELKTPLTAIISSAEMLREKLAPNGEDLEHQLSDNIYKSALAMNRRVSELLDFARVQIGTLELNKELLDVNLVVQDVASQLSPLFAGRLQRLDLEVGQIPAVEADKNKLEQILVNLLSNANKFSPDDSQIIIRTKQSGQGVTVEVEDAAPIISDYEKNKLFIPYYRGEDRKVRQRVPGMGLGLAITKRIIELHGGKIWIDTNPGKGNIFAFSLASP